MSYGEVVPTTGLDLGGGARQEENWGRGCQGRGLPPKKQRW